MHLQEMMHVLVLALCWHPKLHTGAVRGIYRLYWLGFGQVSTPAASASWQPMLKIAPHTHPVASFAGLMVSTPRSCCWLHASCTQPLPSLSLGTDLSSDSDSSTWGQRAEAAAGSTVHKPGSFKPLPRAVLCWMLLHTACHMRCKVSGVTPCVNRQHTWSMCAQQMVLLHQ